MLSCTEKFPVLIRRDSEPVLNKLQKLLPLRRVAVKARPAAAEKNHGAAGERKAQSMFFQIQ